MKQIVMLTQLTISGAIVAAVFAFADLSASAQTADTSTTTSTTSATPTPTTRKRPTTATSAMIDEAMQRTKARAAKFIETGVPEQFGSEEPFTYVPSK